MRHYRFTLPVMTADDCLAAFGLPPAPAFAFLHRPGTAGGTVEVLTGDVQAVRTAGELPLPPPGAPGDAHDVLAVLPYRQIADRGLHCVDDRAPLLAVAVRAHVTVPVATALRLLPADVPDLDVAGFDLPDDRYAATVRRVLRDHIARGDGANFVVRRTFRAAYRNWSPGHAPALFRRLLAAEHGAYWTFVVHAGGRTLAGATPECHLRLDRGTATMNPISGTYRYPPGGPATAGLLRFLSDRKEAGELLMVLDEELKMMARVCDDGGRVHGPRLRPMSRLAHTDYLISGRTRLDVPDLLRLTTPAPTVTGSPVASACRVLAAHERTGRGYYGGVLTLAGRRDGHRWMDSALLIRTADIDARGRVTVDVGATLVQGSDPDAEADETRVKAAALVRALGGDASGGAPGRAPAADARVRAALRRHRAGLSGFWQGHGPPPVAAQLSGRRLLIVDAEDDFTGMLARMAESLRLGVRVRRWDEDTGGGYDVLLAGPGPGDPRDRHDPRVEAIRTAVRRALAAGTPLLAVCLGHQVLAAELGLAVTRLGEPAQGVRRRIRLGDRTETVGFYHSFAAEAGTDEVRSPLVAGPVRVLRERGSRMVLALSGPRLRSVQFHVESVLTEHGPAILAEMLISVLGIAQFPTTGTPEHAGLAPE